MPTRRVKSEVKNVPFVQEISKNMFITYYSSRYMQMAFAFFTIYHSLRGTTQLHILQGVTNLNMTANVNQEDLQLVSYETS